MIQIITPKWFQNINKPYLYVYSVFDFFLIQPFERTNWANLGPWIQDIYIYIYKIFIIIYIRKMDSIYSIVHITLPSRYEKIIEDGYLRPFRSIQLKNLWFSNSTDKKLKEFFICSWNWCFLFYSEKKGSVEKDI